MRRRSGTSPGKTPDLTGNHTWIHLHFSLRDVLCDFKQRLIDTLKESKI